MWLKPRWKKRITGGPAPKPASLVDECYSQQMMLLWKWHLRISKTWAGPLGIHVGLLLLWHPPEKGKEIGIVLCPTGFSMCLLFPPFALSRWEHLCYDIWIWGHVHRLKKKQMGRCTIEERKKGMQMSEPILFWNVLELLLWVEELLLTPLLLSFAYCLHS